MTTLENTTQRICLAAFLLTHVFTLCQGQNLTYGSNVRLGNSAGSSLTAKSVANVMIGESAGMNTTDGIVNVIIGHQAGINNTTGNYNTFIGNGAGASNITGQYNTCIGDGSGYQMNANGNMLLGVHAGFNTTTGANNVMIGSGAGKVNTIGSNNILIGNNANVGQGDLQNAIAIGADAVVSQNNTLVLGASGVKVGIGVSKPQYALTVAGEVGARSVNVTSETWSDFVFDDTYKLQSLPDLARFIRDNHHLPEIPSTKEVLENGIDLGKMDQKLLQKIEEITLYMLQQNEQIQKLKSETYQLRKLLNKKAKQ